MPLIPFSDWSNWKQDTKVNAARIRTLIFVGFWGRCEERMVVLSIPIFERQTEKYACKNMLSASVFSLSIVAFQNILLVLTLTSSTKVLLYKYINYNCKFGNILIIGSKSSEFKVQFWAIFVLWPFRRVFQVLESFFNFNFITWEQSAAYFELLCQKKLNNFDKMRPKTHSSLRFHYFCGLVDIYCHFVFVFCIKKLYYQICWKNLSGVGNWRKIANSQEKNYQIVSLPECFSYLYWFLRIISRNTFSLFLRSKIILPTQ